MVTQPFSVDFKACAQVYIKSCGIQLRSEFHVHCSRMWTSEQLNTNQSKHFAAELLRKELQKLWKSVVLVSLLSCDSPGANYFRS